MSNSKKTLFLLASLCALLLIGVGLYAQFIGFGVPVTQLDAKQQAALIRPHSTTLGKPDAKVTMVEFFDPACSTCGRYYPIVKRIHEENPDVRLVLRYAPFHKGSDTVVRLLEAAKLQGKFWPVLELLLAKMDEWKGEKNALPNLDKVYAFAASAGLDIAKAKVDMETPEIVQAVQQDQRDVDVLGIGRTPTFIVNNKILDKLTEENLHTLVKESMPKTK